MSYNFAEPLALVLLLLVPAVYYLHMIHKKKKKNAILRFSRIGLLKSAAGEKRTRRKNVTFYMLLVVLILLILGAADPHIPLKQAKEGVNVVLVIDDSGSMAATDYKPTRLEAAKGSAEILINSLQSKDNAGIIVFESGATTASYISPFKERVLEKLRSIQQKEGQTAIGDGLGLAVDMAMSIPNKKKVIILLSDGVTNAGVITPQEAAEYARMNNIQVYTIGMGSTEPVILGYDWFGRPRYAELDEETLKNIAEHTGGEYYKSVDSETLNKIYSNISEEIEREWEDTGIKDWFILAAIIVLVFYIYVIYGKYRVIM